ncbi:MAG: hypothetical protein FRX49_05285 [Trebouxia sp. A1-2]|nr:MAG: hypothetical protein FRX49_05285 [Trebouxia sp. A1-2]
MHSIFIGGFRFNNYASSPKVINLNKVSETKGQMLNILVLHGFLLLLYICCLSADSLQAMSLALVGLTFVACNLKRIKASNMSLLR